MCETPAEISLTLFVSPSASVAYSTRKIAPKLQIKQRFSFQSAVAICTCQVVQHPSQPSQGHGAQHQRLHLLPPLALIQRIQPRQPVQLIILLYLGQIRRRRQVVVRSALLLSRHIGCQVRLDGVCRGRRGDLDDDEVFRIRGDAEAAVCVGDLYFFVSFCVVRSLLRRFTSEEVKGGTGA